MNPIASRKIEDHPLVVALVSAVHRLDAIKYKLVRSISDENVAEMHAADDNYWAARNAAEETLNALDEFATWMKGGVEEYDDGSVRAAAQDLYDDVVAIRKRTASGTPPANVYADIRAERARQDAKHGGPKHDDTHTVWEWKHFRELREHRVTDMLDSPHEAVYEPADGRRALVEIAALAVAQIEALDRKHGGAK